MPSEVLPLLFTFYWTWKAQSATKLEREMLEQGPYREGNATPRSRKTGDNEGRKGK